MSEMSDSRAWSAEALGFEHIVQPERRALLVALAELGIVKDACAAVGVKPQHVAIWNRDPVFAEAYRLALELGSDALIREARRRATEGVREYKFAPTGEPLRHPTECTCGHGVDDHRREFIGTVGRDIVAEKTARGKRTPMGQNVVTYLQCGLCSCDAFFGRPYYEDKRSDLLLMFTIKGVREEYKDAGKVQVGVFNVDAEFMRRLPDEVVERIARGEPLHQVLATLPALPPGKKEGQDHGLEEAGTAAEAPSG